MKRTKRECYIGEDGYCHVPLANGKGEAICDAEFMKEVNKRSWRYTPNGYASASINNKQIFMHRFLFFIEFGNINNGFVIDHVNRNKLDNRIINLRQATYAENSRNNNRKTGKFKGVWFDKKRNKYEASIKANGKTLHLHSSTNEKDCAIIYDIAALYYYGEFANLNFPHKIEEYKIKIPKKKPFEEKPKTSKFIGVHLCRGKFYAYCNGKHIGSFDIEEQAAKIRDLYIIKNNLNKKLNFPKETYEHELSQESKQMIVFKAN